MERVVSSYSTSAHCLRKNAIVKIKLNNLRSVGKQLFLAWFLVVVCFVTIFVNLIIAQIQLFAVLTWEFESSDKTIFISSISDTLFEMWQQNFEIFAFIFIQNFAKLTNVKIRFKNTFAAWDDVFESNAGKNSQRQIFCVNLFQSSSAL